MKVLLDECIDVRLAKEITGHTVETVASMKWIGVKNGELLTRTQEAGFDVFLTVDRNLQFQQTVENFKFSIVVLRSNSNRIADLLPLVPALLRLLPHLKPGELKVIATTTGT